jgi:tetratricopeptide (TPR) repeat protein
MSIQKLEADYREFINNFYKSGGELDILEAKKLLKNLRQSGEYINSPEEREILSAWCRTIADIIYEATDEFLPVRISPFNCTTVSAESVSPSKLYTIPSPQPYFKGRNAEIEDIIKNVIIGKKNILLCGKEGIGKTALALIISEKLKALFPDGRIFIDMQGWSENPLKPAECVANIIHAISPAQGIPNEIDKLIDIYYSILEDKRVLILLDNATNQDQIEVLIPPSGCTLIITSREEFPLVGAYIKILDVLSSSDASELLLTNANRIGDNVNELSKVCYNMPLLLHNAGCIINNRIEIDVEDYINQLKEAKNNSDPEYASFKFSYGLLSPEKQSFWCSLSMFPGSFNHQEASKIIDVDINQAKENLSELVAYGLIESYCINTEESYYFHILARNFIKSQLDQSTYRSACLLHSRYYRDRLSAIESRYMIVENNIRDSLELFDNEWINIRAGRLWAEKVLQEIKQKLNQDRSELENIALHLCIDYPNIGANILNARLSRWELMRWLNAALDASQLLKDRNMVSLNLKKLGDVYKDINKIRQSIELYNQALTSYREIGDQQAECNILITLGNSHFSLGDIRRAIDLQEQALTIAREIGDRKSECESLKSLGHDYNSLGDIRKSIEFYEQALTIAREIGDRKSECESLESLGGSYDSLGDIRRAIDLQEQALTIAREIGDRKAEGISMLALGNDYISFGDIRKSIEFYEQALTIAQETEDLRTEGKCLGSLGNAYQTLGMFRKSIDYIERSLAIFRNLEARRSEASSLHNLGSVYISLGDIRKSIELFEQSLAIEREIGNRHGEAATLANLGRAYSALGDVQKAIVFFEQSLAISQHLGTLEGECIILENLGVAKCKLGKVNESIELFERSIEISKEKGFRSSEASTLINLGFAYQINNEFGKAIELYGIGSKIAHEIGELHLEAKSLFYKSNALNINGQKEQAIDTAKSALNILEGIDSPLKDSVRDFLIELQK